MASSTVYDLKGNWDYVRVCVCVCAFVMIEHVSCIVNKTRSMERISMIS
jgi:hypothetical protein